ncbi:hypothetical protein ACQR1H_15275 [Bradyrhizobium sp. HKCCYLRH2015]|uniref:hypothetical protein n=1 Tax=Bradyrhizobium oligotrophicum TaxID=44255 RepID=UPI003EC0C874
MSISTVAIPSPPATIAARTRKRQWFRTEHAAEPGIEIRGVAPHSRMRTGIALATANTEVTPVIRIGDIRKAWR